MSYSPMAMPPQTPTQVFVCDRCSALVFDPVQHDAAGHAAPVATLLGTTADGGVVGTAPATTITTGGA